MDAINLTEVVYHNSPSIADWTATSTLEEVGWRSAGNSGVITVKHSKRGKWTPVVIAPDGTTQEATIWLFRFYNGKWHGAGAERLRPGQFEKELGRPFDMNSGWLYDPNRWGDMANRPFVDGEVVGFCVSSGDMRGRMFAEEKERSDVRLYKVGTFSIAPSEQAPVVVPPPPPPTPTPTPACQCDKVLEEVKKLSEKLDNLELHSGPFTLPLPRLLGGTQTIQDIVLKVKK